MVRSVEARPPTNDRSALPHGGGAGEDVPPMTRRTQQDICGVEGVRPLHVPRLWKDGYA